jgi:hypothetical protein
VCIYRSLGFSEASMLAALGVGLGAHFLEARLRAGRGSVDSSGALLASARRVKDELGVELVVMGHTHVPSITELDAAARYINLGSWAEADPGEGWAAQPSSRTHLVIPTGKVSAARLFRWENMRPVGYQERPVPGRAGQEAAACPAVETALGVLRGAPGMALAEFEPGQTEAA